MHPEVYSGDEGRVHGIAKKDNLYIISGMTRQRKTG